jgi:hypothetical protein
MGATPLNHSPDLEDSLRLVICIWVDNVLEGSHIANYDLGTKVGRKTHFIHSNDAI